MLAITGNDTTYHKGNKNFRDLDKVNQHLVDVSIPTLGDKCEVPINLENFEIDAAKRSIRTSVH